ncbi:MAG TPA: hypothetical protein VN688_11910 [Gemmataceae bacterium]|nr:hypothetical protein [Gemmataceae bacterium]
MPDTASENILVRLVQAQAQSVDDTLKSWQLPRGKPPSEVGLSRLVQIGVRLYDDMEGAYTEGYARAVKDASLSLADLQRERQAFGEIFRTGAQAAYRLWEFLDRIAKTTGQPIKGADRLRQTAEQFKHLQARLADEWPVCSPEEEREARTSSERGEGMELDDAFAEIAGVDKASWLERVAEYKRKHLQGGQE